MTAVALTRRGAPWTALAALVLAVPLAAVTSFGAFYFSFVYEDAQVSAFSIAFCALFWALTATGVAAVAGVVRGRRRSWSVALAYGIAGVLWSIAKLVFWHEPESLVFGTASLLLIALMAAQRTRRWVS